MRVTLSARMASMLLVPEVKIARVVLLLPAADQLLLLGIAQHHERRRAGRVDHVDAHPRELRDLRLVGGDRRLEFVERAALHVERQRNEPDALRQDSQQLLEAAGALGRAHDADGAARSFRRHASRSPYFAARRAQATRAGDRPPAAASSSTWRTMSVSSRPPIQLVSRPIFLASAEILLVLHGGVECRLQRGDAIRRHVGDGGEDRARHVELQRHRSAAARGRRRSARAPSPSAHP